MDHENDGGSIAEVIAVTGPDSQQRDIIALVAAYKERRVTVRSGPGLLTEENRPGSRLAIAGFWPAIEYMEERFPYPTIYMETPIQRGILRSIVEQLFDDPNGILDALKSGTPGTLVHSVPTIVDFAAYAACDPADPFWKAHMEALSQWMCRGRRPRCMTA